MRIILGIILACMLLIPSTALGASSLGSSQSSRSSDIFQGEQTTFRIFLFNVHQESDIEIYLGVLESGGLDIELSHEEIIIPYTEPGKFYESDPGFVYIGTSAGDVKAKEVVVRVKAPLTIEPGKREVSVFATTRKDSGTVGTAQVRRFFFDANVLSQEREEVIDEVETRAEESNSSETIPKRDEQTEDNEGINAAKEDEVLELSQDMGLPITGDVSAIPVFGPIVLLAVALIAIFLWRQKRI